jgi:hypothetical protein
VFVASYFGNLLVAIIGLSQATEANINNKRMAQKQLPGGHSLVHKEDHKLEKGGRT